MCDAVRFLPLAVAVALSPIAPAQDRGPRRTRHPASSDALHRLPHGRRPRDGGHRRVLASTTRTFAIAFNLRIDEGSQYEIFYGRRRRTEPDGVRPRPVDVESTTSTSAGRYGRNDEQRWRPYIVGGSAPRGSGRSRRKRATAPASRYRSAAGLRIPFSERFSVRLEARGFVTFVDTDSALFCKSGRSARISIRADGNTFIQYEALGAPPSPSESGPVPDARMPSTPDITNMAVFCDFENVALGVRDAKYAALRHPARCSSACC